MRTPEQDKYGDPDAKSLDRRRSRGNIRCDICRSDGRIRLSSAHAVRPSSSAPSVALLDALTPQRAGHAGRAEPRHRLVAQRGDGVRGAPCCTTAARRGAADPSGRGRPAGRLRIARPDRRRPRHRPRARARDGGRRRRDGDGAGRALRRTRRRPQPAAAALDLAGKLSRAVLRTSGQPMSAVARCRRRNPRPARHPYPGRARTDHPRRLDRHRSGRRAEPAAAATGDRRQRRRHGRGRRTRVRRCPVVRRLHLHQGIARRRRRHRPRRTHLPRRDRHRGRDRAHPDPRRGQLVPVRQPRLPRDGRVDRPGSAAARARAVPTAATRPRSCPRWPSWPRTRLRRG